MSGRGQTLRVLRAFSATSALDVLSKGPRRYFGMSSALAPALGAPAFTVVVPF